MLLIWQTLLACYIAVFAWYDSLDDVRWSLLDEHSSLLGIHILLIVLYALYLGWSVPRGTYWYNPNAILHWREDDGRVCKVGSWYTSCSHNRSTLWNCHRCAGVLHVYRRTINHSGWFLSVFFLSLAFSLSLSPSPCIMVQWLYFMWSLPTAMCDIQRIASDVIFWHDFCNECVTCPL